MNDDDEESRNKRLQEERLRAREILADPQSNQLARDLAHLRLEHEEGSFGYGSLKDKSSYDSFKASYDIPEEWLRVEAYERDLMDFSNEEVVALAEDPLLQNKCKTMKVAVGPDGKPNVFLAFPKLTRAVHSLLDSGTDRQIKASANAVMACLVRVGDRAASIDYFRKAIKVRPTDWRLRNAIASSYMSVGKTSLALEALTQAAELTPEGSYERFDVESCRGKVLFNLGRHEEAKTNFLSVLAAAEKFKDRMSSLDAAHIIVIEYMLCTIFATEKNRVMCKRQWDSAEAKRIALPDDVRQRIDWESRHFAQTLMAALSPDLLSHRECHNCRKLCSDPKRCSSCKAAYYCSRECQVAAWRAGHKNQCKSANVTRKVEKKEKKAAVKKQEAVSNLPPLDATLDPYALWAKAKKLSKETGKAEDAVFNFTVALFLDFSLDAQDMNPAKAAVDACEPGHPLALALGMITRMNKRDLLGHIETNHHKALEYIQNHGGKHQLLSLDASTSLEQVDRVRFGLAMCMTFRARIMGRCFAVKSMEQAQSAAHKEAFDVILQLIDDVKLHLPTERWLTIQFELGYSNLDVGAADEAKHWLEMFVNNLAALERANNGRLTKHWKQMRKTASAKLQMVQMMQAAQRAGMMP